MSAISAKTSAYGIRLRAESALLTALISSSSLIFMSCSKNRNVALGTARGQDRDPRDRSGSTGSWLVVAEKVAVLVPVVDAPLIANDAVPEIAIPIVSDDTR